MYIATMSHLLSIIDVYIYAKHVYMYIIGMTKIKFSKSEEGGAAFIERRRANLERYTLHISSI